MYTVAAALYPHALATSITLPMEILQAASQLARARNRDSVGITFLKTAADLSAVPLASGIEMRPDIMLSELPDVDVLLLPAIWRNPLPTLNNQRQLLPILTNLARRGCRICSVGTASYLLAESGLLDNRPATTHWHYFERFARRYPQIQLKTRHLITQSDNLFCVGSVNSIADLMIHIIEGWFGSLAARAVEKQFSPEIRQSFHGAAYQTDSHSSHHDETILQAQQWLQDHLHENISLTRLASYCGLSSRSLSRRFRQATDLSPQGYLQRLRMTSARDLLRHSNLSVSEIAWQVGFQDASYFSQLFRRHTGMPPARYRKSVRGKLFAPEPA